MNITVIFACTAGSGRQITVASPSLPFSCDPADVLRTSMHKMRWIGYGEEARTLEALLMRTSPQIRTDPSVSR